jgi:octaprenyl-diphosphate synthase
LDPRDVFDKMEDLLKNYSEKARAGLRRIPDGESKNNLETLIEFTMFKV